MSSAIMIWEANPELVTIAGVPVRYYGLLFAIGLLLGYNIVKYIFKRENVNIRYLDILLMYILVGTLVGARLGHCLFYDFEYYKHHILEIFIPFQNVAGHWEYVGFMGLASHGGAIGVLLAIYLFCRKYKIGAFWLLDRIAIGVPITGAFIRFGNFMNSEIYGKPTNGNWGIIFANDDMIPRHPTQLYEAFGYILVSVILWMLYRSGKVKSNGIFFSYFLISMFSIRFILEFFKENQVSFENDMVLNLGQWLSIPFIIIGFVLLIFNDKMKKITAYVPTNIQNN